MIDHFATLGLPRQPWLEEETVKTAFQQHSARLHPDASGGSEQAFTELNAAWQTLRDPASRLRHWLELTSPNTPSPSALPAELGDLFMEIAPAKQNAERLHARRSAATTPLAQALLEGERLAAKAKLETVRTKLAHTRDMIFTELRAGLTDPALLAPLHQRLVYLTKWTEQIREALVFCH